VFETTKVVRVADVAVGCRLLVVGIRVDDHPHDADDANNDAASISSRSLPPKNDSRDDALTVAVAAMGGTMMMMDAAAAADTTAGILFGYSKQ
jgi:hypothetical protein